MLIYDKYDNKYREVIDVNVIKEKIEELENLIKKEEEETSGRCITIGKWETIQILQELLEDFEETGNHMSRIN